MSDPELRKEMSDPTEEKSFRDPNEPTARTAFPVIMIIVGAIFIISIAIAILLNL